MQLLGTVHESGSTNMQRWSCSSCSSSRITVCGYVSYNAWLPVSESFQVVITPAHRMDLSNSKAAGNRRDESGSSSPRGLPRARLSGCEAGGSKLSHLCSCRRLHASSPGPFPFTAASKCYSQMRRHFLLFAVSEQGKRMEWQSSRA